MMAPVELLTLLRNLLAKETVDPADRLAVDLTFLPESVRRSPTAQIETVSRIVSEERLKRAINNGVARFEDQALSVIGKLHDEGRKYAEVQYLKFLTQAMEAGRKSAPIGLAARRQAYWQIALGFVFAFVVAWFAVIGAMRLGYLNTPALTESENRQLAWAKSIESHDRVGAVEWASTQLDSARKLEEARTAIDHLNAGNSLEAELQSYASCQGSGRQIGMDTAHRPYCYYYLNPSEAPPWAAY